MDDCQKKFESAVEHGSFTPLLFSAMGGMGRETTKFYSRLAEILADRKNTQYSFFHDGLNKEKDCLLPYICLCCDVHKEEQIL